MNARLSCASVNSVKFEIRAAASAINEIVAPGRARAANPTVTSESAGGRLP
jgi:hypothetical protein